MAGIPDGPHRIDKAPPAAGASLAAQVGSGRVATLSGDAATNLGDAVACAVRPLPAASAPAAAWHEVPYEWHGAVRPLPAASV